LPQEKYFYPEKVHKNFLPLKNFPSHPKRRRNLLITNTTCKKYFKIIFQKSEPSYPVIHMYIQPEKVTPRIVREREYLAGHVFTKLS